MATRHDIIRHSTLSILKAIRVLGAAVAERVAGVAKILRNRRNLEFLASLDDRMLRDIGLTRSDLRSALSEAFWRDPGAALISRVGQRGSAKVRRSSVPSVRPPPSGWGGRAMPGHAP